MTKHDNFLAVYEALLARLNQIEGLGAVKEIGELAQISQRKIAPLDNAVYVVFSGAYPLEKVGGGRFLTFKLYFTLVYCANFNGASRVLQLGQKALSIYRALVGHRLDVSLADAPFQCEKPPAMDYQNGFVFFPMVLSVEVSSKMEH